VFFQRHLLHLIASEKLSVFLFHKVPPSADALVPNDLDHEKFSVVLDFVAEHFHVLPLADAVKLLAEGKLPARAASITFDDGYPEWPQGVAEILARRSIPATFFITTGQFEGRPMWHERLANVVRTFRGDVLDTRAVRLPPLEVGAPAQRAAAVQALEFHFKYLPPAIRDRFLAELEASVGARMEDVPAFSTKDLAVIADKGFEIGAHTVDHPILGLCNADLARDEIGKTREILEGIIRRPVRSFAYPNGRPGVDFSYRHIDMVKAAGYDYAVTTQWGVARRDTSPFQIPRFTPWGPSRRQMSFQVLRNIFTLPESIPEARH
jgi:peptidoglycan/xylan/chitin deacetylase (PgdA/CDA1 family)